MKVGLHAQESLAEIITRKRQEIEDVGYSMWGYGGMTCFPTTMVQPFAKEARASGSSLVLYMQRMDSNHRADRVRAETFSVDSVHWQPVPAGINVFGSRFALCINALESIDDAIDLARSHVAIGLSRGKRGDKYISGRVDKACLVGDDTAQGAEADIHPVHLRATFVEPFAVFVDENAIAKRRRSKA
jgi:hypothetical protein